MATRVPLSVSLTVDEQRSRMVGDVCVDLAGGSNVALISLRLRQLDDRELLRNVWDPAQQVRDAIDPGASLVIGLHHEPGCFGDVRMYEHVVLGPRVVDPSSAGGEVGRRELPPPHRIGDAGLESAALFLLTDGEPVLDEVDPVVDEQALESGALPQEQLVLDRGAEAENSLDAGPVVPAPVEQDHLARRRQLSDVALEVPLW